MAVASFTSHLTGPNRPEEVNAWWSTLRHEGVLISPLVLEEALPTGPRQVPDSKLDYLRNKYQRFINQPDNIGDWLDVVFERLLGQISDAWRNGPRVPMEYHGQRRKATRVLLAEPPKEKIARLLVYVDKDRVTTPEGTPGRIGFHKGRREYAEFVRLLQETGVSVGVLTNGHQFRLIHTTMDQARWVEWDAKAWFEGGDGRAALHGFVNLLGEEALPQGDPKQSPLYRWIQDSRQRQADLSHVMGTQVREAVEVLLQEVDDCLIQSPQERQKEIFTRLRDLNMRREEELRALYQAAIRIVMRLVVVLYAESRELFPVSNSIYHDSYSVEGLFHILQRARTIEGEEALQREFDAWPRLQALFRFVHAGSIHPDLTLTAYDGDLFRPSHPKEDDEVVAAITVLEHPSIRISDAAILKVLEKLKVGQFKTGRGSWQTGPVDFRDLRTEYIGMMYEGLLDYDLREARKEDRGIVVLNLGDQPALPFRILQHATEDPPRLRRLIEDLKEKTSSKVLATKEVEEDEEEDEESMEKNVEQETPEKEPEEIGEEDEEDIGDTFERTVHDWAKGVVKTTNIFMPPTDIIRRWDPTRQAEEVDRAARKLKLRAIPPGGTYLVRWSGTRRGTGTFYTKPGLAVPTVHRTLEPLVYNINESGLKVPKLPEEILRLKVCDPAMGSGSFLVAALNYLTQALKESFEINVLSKLEKGEPVTEMGHRARGVLNERILPVLRDEEHEDIEARMEAQLKRAVVEHCIYGVDINPLAVELGKLSLWIETMDPHLPFTFLDHKIRCGNSIIGAWLHEYMHYPIAAWHREVGDGKDNARIQRIKKLLNERIKPQMSNYLKRAQHDTHWFEEKKNIVDLTASARAIFDKLHAAPSEEDRERIYREEFKTNEDVIELRHLMDRWCAIWFWPVDDDVLILDPEAFYGEPKNDELDEVIRKLAQDKKLNFFHWELEFPDVFYSSNRGFDCIFMNPPWEQLEPNENEVFSSFDPSFPTLSDIERGKIKRLLQNHPEVIEYYRTIENTSFFLRHIFANDLNNIPKEYKIRRVRAKGKINLYREFISHLSILLRDRGHFGFICPSGILSDINSGIIRNYLKNSLGLYIVNMYQNTRKQFFNIPPQNKFACLIGGWGNGIICLYKEGLLLVKLHNEIPEIFGWPEFEDSKSAEIFLKIAQINTKFENIGCVVGGELNTTVDRKNRNYIEVNTEPEIHQDWIPVFQGASIDRFDGIAKSYDFTAQRWKPINDGDRLISNRYLNPERETSKLYVRLKMGFKLLSKPQINPRSAIGAVMPICSTVHTLGIIGSRSPEEILYSCGIFNSYIFDFFLRYLLQGQTITKEHIKKIPIPIATDSIKKRIADIVYHLNCTKHVKSAEYPKEYGNGRMQINGDKIKLEEELDYLVCLAYNLQNEDMKWILRSNNSDPRSLWHDYSKRLYNLGGIGKWGIIKPEDMNRLSNVNKNAKEKEI